MTIRTFDSADALSQAAAELIADRLAQTSGPFHIALSGGSTPKKLHAILAAAPYADSIDWSRLNIWWGDDRYVPADHDQSNEGMANATLLDFVPIPKRNIHPMYRGVSQEADAATYEAELLADVPEGKLDLVLLGMGGDGHTASLFPGEPSLAETERLVIAATGHAGVRERITLTRTAINQAKEVLFLIAGADKAEPLYEVISGEFNPTKYPSQYIVRESANVTLLIDSAAAAKL